MASLYEHLLETLPVHGALAAACANTGKDRDKLSVSDLARVLRYLPPGTSYEAQSPSLSSRIQQALQSSAAKDLSIDVTKEQGVWSWNFDASTPNSVSDIYCRTRDADFIPQCVLRSIEWGLEETIGDFRPIARVTGTNGEQYELPLTPEFVKQTWVTIAGWTPPQGHWLWPLETLQDRGLVVAFIYEVDPASGAVQPFRPDSIHEQPWQEAEGAALDLSGPVPEPTEADPATDADSWSLSATDVPWSFRGDQGELMPMAAQAPTPQGEIGGTVQAEASRAVVLVMLSLATCRERGEFEPEDVVGVARLFPNAIVKASIPLSKIELTARLDRAETTMRRGDAQSAGCCRAFDATDDVLRAMLVTDSNEWQLIPLPHWPNMFQYYMTDPFAKAPLQRIRVVSRDLAFEREDDSGWVEREQLLDIFKTRTVAKQPRQGEYDNVHISPRLQLVRCPSVKIVGGSYEGPTIVPVDRTAMRLDDIAMAPFCAHDCFHMHFRWSTASKGVWTLGWGQSGPNLVPGAPMVPVNQDVHLWFRGPASLSYHATVYPRLDEPQIEALTIHPVLHHGAGYAVATAGWVLSKAAQLAVGTLVTGQHFLDENGNEISSMDSSAMFYWRLRYKMELSADGSSCSAVERVIIHDEASARGF